MNLEPKLLAKVDSFESLAQLFHDELQWPKATWNRFDDVAGLYGIPKDDGVESISVLREFVRDQTWGIFQVDFGNNKLRRSQLRSILNKVADKERRREHAERTWAHENILFICRSETKTWTLGHYIGDKPATAKLKTFGWSDPSEARTAIENLNKLSWEKQGSWIDAWNVERLSDAFFDELYDRFLEIEALWKPSFSAEDRRTATQLLLNRLLFVCFLQQKGWLELHDSRSDYLFRLFESTDTNDPEADTFSRKLEYLFFSGLNSSNATPGDRKLLEKEIGRVPFLNGGLFERTAVDTQQLPNRAYNALIGQGGLLRSYNFTIEEGTPLDVDVAIDPEMLGKVFEELVNKRHDTGSYYTPRPIVSFMCREALKGYLGGHEKLVDDHDAGGITVVEARSLLAKLERVKFCDPACGSGAYLVGMLQEIFAMQRLLDTAAHNVREDYQRKKVIIENCLYGVDLEKFAVTIAWLRLWLALVIDNPVNPLDDPTADVALPNLDLKLEAGDSIASGDPKAAVVQTVVKKKSAQVGLDFEGVDSIVSKYIHKRAEYQDSHGDDKRTIHKEILALKLEIKRRVTTTGFSDRAFLWPIEYPEVFLSEDPEFVKGFDIVLANPPYVRQETIKETMGEAYKKSLVASYPDTGSPSADLFIYFYDRGLQLLKPSGMFVYISSNKWFKANYGAKLRKQIAKVATIQSITDFGDLPVFKSALAYAMIFVARRAPLADGDAQAPIYTSVESLRPPFPDVKAVVNQFGSVLPPDSIAGDIWTLADAGTLDMLRKMKQRGIPLGEYVKDQIYYGIKTGLNEAFVINGSTRQRLIDEDPRSAEIIKPVAVGKDIRRWRIEDRDRWIILTKIGVNMKRYPAIMAHLNQYETQLRKRTDQGNNWWELRACAYYDVFEHPKLAYPDMAQEPRFTLAPAGLMLTNTAYLLPSSDLYLLGVLNSAPFSAQLDSMLNKNQGDTQRTFSGVFAKAIVPLAPDTDKDEIGRLAEDILDLKSANPEANVAAIEGEINARIEFLYFHNTGAETYDQWKSRLEAEVQTEIGAMRAIMKSGEDDKAEFKASVIWDTFQDKHNLVMRDEVLKEVCAFLNSEGGTILCGVDDDGNLLGLAKDIKHAGNKDKLGMVITNALGDLLKPNPVELVKMKFIEIDGETILRIQVQGDPKHRYESPSTKKEDAGKNIPKTHVRIHATAKALDVGEAIAWWNRRSGTA